ncbi:MAG TPA: helix-turn-helix transcriptional regulator [Candidatus Limnocylindrales bacterium]|nr:helix-turn-helix transcriptional regulator [Candidatus Limnocylindrales bacterium]
MDALRIGRSLRALRIRRGLRQADVAAAARCSQSQVSKIERGDLDGVTTRGLATICRTLGADLDLRVRWHGEGLDRLLDEAHARLVNALVARLGRDGWRCEVEASFSVRGERGSIDVLAWHAAARALLVVEVKSVVPDAQSMLVGLDRKTRIASTLAGDRGWDPLFVGRLLAINDSSTTRRRVRELGAMFEAALPARGPCVRAWLHSPSGRLAGLLFLPVNTPGGIGRPLTGRQRVNRPRTSGIRAG